MAVEIATTLKDFPLVNQLHEQTADKQPDENADWNCVVASLSAGLMNLLPGKTFDGDELKDVVYGQGYTGGMAPSKFVSYCARLGVTLKSVQGTYDVLVARVHAELASGHPVIATIPSKWGVPRAQQTGDWTTHVVCFAGYGAGTLRAMNPWGGVWQDEPDAYWVAELCYGEVWVMERTAGATAVPATSPTDIAGAEWIGTPHFWPGRPHGAPTFVIVHGTGSNLHNQASDEAHYFQGDHNASAHYVIGRDGHIVQCVREHDTAWSNGPITGAPGTSGDGQHHDTWWDVVPPLNPNYRTISIEHVNDAENGVLLTPHQEAASFKLIRDICTRWHIPMRPADALGGITGHYSIDPMNRARCPGPAYPWGALFAALRAPAPVPVPAAQQVAAAAAQQEIATLTQQVAALHAQLAAKMPAPQTPMELLGAFEAALIADYEAKKAKPA